MELLNEQAQMLVFLLVFRLVFLLVVRLVIPLVIWPQLMMIWTLIKQAEEKLPSVQYSSTSQIKLIAYKAHCMLPVGLKGEGALATGESGEAAGATTGEAAGATTGGAKRTGPANYFQYLLANLLIIWWARLSNLPKMWM